jgi:hypothetical protein
MSFVFSGIANVTLPIAVISIGQYCFFHYLSLIEISLAASIISEIPAACFFGCRALRNVSLPLNKGGIGEDAFYGTALTFVDFPIFLTEIGCSALGSSRLVAVDLSWTAVAVIGRDAFANISALAVVVLSPETSSVGEGAFEGSLAI